MSFYDEMAETADELLEEFGTSLTISRPATGQYDPDTDTFTAGAATTGTFKSVILPASKGKVETFDNRYTKDQLNNDSLRYVLAAAMGTDFEPKAGDSITFEGSVWIVLGCTPLKPAGVALLYGIGVQK